LDAERTNCSGISGIFCWAGVGGMRALGSALRAAYFLLPGQKKVSKEKATPGLAPRCAGFPALLETGGGCATRLGNAKTQTVLALFPPASPLLGARQGDPENRPGIQRVDLNKALVLMLPCTSSSSAGRSGKKGEHCLRATGPSCAAPRTGRAAQSTRRSRAMDRARLFFGYHSFGEAKESSPPARRNQTSISPLSFGNR
jgi:hypothetical protein